MGLAGKVHGWSYRPGERHFVWRAKEAGYKTALVGVQHVALDAAELGYDEVYPLCPAGQLKEQAGHVLRRLCGDGPPFYLEVGFFEPHRPYDFGGAGPDERSGVAVPGYLPNTSEARKEMAAVQGAIRAMDEAVGHLLSELDRTGQADRTWVIFTTDHGLAMPRAKSTLYDPGIETALLMRWPGAGVIGGRVLEEMISNVDIVPTMLEAIGVPISPEVQGISFWPLLCGEMYQARSEIFAEKTFHTQYEPMRAIRTERHKLIVNLELGPKINVPSDIQLGPLFPQMIEQCVNARSKVELFDLATDPLEMTNLVDKPEYASLRGELTGRLLEWMAKTGDPILQGPIASSYYKEALELLRSGQPVSRS
jgi:arylsulfatase A-like enzyme